MKIIYVLLIISFFTNSFCANAQNVIAVQQGNSPRFYTSLDTAIVHATDGDTVYIPGGNFTLAVNINKRLHLIGVGHNPDSTLATNPTNITGNIVLSTSASNGSLVGIKLLGGISFGSSGSALSEYSIGRCYITGGISSGSSLTANNILYENILVGGISLSSSLSNYFYNNIIGNRSQYIGTGSIFKNNIFLWNNGNWYLQYTDNSIFENNVFCSGAVFYSSANTWCSNNIFNNNLFAYNIYFPYTTNNTGINNIVNQTASSIFVNQSGTTFSYAQDYHIQNSSPGHNGGKDGTDVGIYGGTTYPWKDGSVPFNPHIQFQSINGSTNSSGALPVNIRVGAQDH